MQDKPIEEPPKFIDFQIVSRLVYLCNLTNQLFSKLGVQDIELEHALLTYTLSFKSQIITDSRLLLIASHIANLNDKDSNASESLLYGTDTDNTKTKQAYNIIA